MVPGHYDYHVLEICIKAFEGIATFEKQISMFFLPEDKRGILADIWIHLKKSSHNFSLFHFKIKQTQAWHTSCYIQNAVLVAQPLAVVSTHFVAGFILF